MRCLIITLTLVTIYTESVFSAAADVKNKCKDGKDLLGCLNYKAMDVVKEALSKDSLEIMDGVKLIKTKEVSVKENGRSLEENIEELLETHDVELDIAGTKVTVSPKETGEITLTLNSEDKLDEARKRKSKLRKLLVPLMVFVLLKAMTLIPLALGVLGLKAWNALQLSFFSFVASLAMAIFNLFKKIASDAPPLPVAHIAEPYHYAAARNLLLPNSEDGQQMAYSAYQQMPTTSYLLLYLLAIFVRLRLNSKYVNANIDRWLMGKEQKNQCWLETCLCMFAYEFTRSWFPRREFCCRRQLQDNSSS